MKGTTRSLLSGACTIVAVLLASILMGEERGSMTDLVIALVPLPFMIWFIFEEVRLLRRTDEFHRRVVLEAFAISFPASIFLAISIEATQKAGFLRGIGIGDLWPFMALTFIPCLFFVYRRYDRDG